MDRYIGDILTGAGADSRNDSYVGISQEDALRYANWAQMHLQGIITRRYPSAFIYTYTQNLTADVGTYSVNDNLYLNSRIVRVRYNASSTDERSWMRLLPISPYETQLPQSGTPRYYARVNGDVEIFPMPSTTTGRLEIRYERELDRLELRRGQVDGTPGLSTIDLSHATFGSPTAETEARLVRNEYVSIVNEYGVVLMRNATIDTYNSGTDVISTNALISTYLVTGYTAAHLAEKYLTIGKWTTTHSQLPNAAEPYISQYVERKLFRRDSSNDANALDRELRDVIEDIISNYKLPDKDPKPIPVIDDELLVYGQFPEW